MLKNNLKDPWTKEDCMKESKASTALKNSSKYSIKKVVMPHKQPPVDLEALGCKKWDEEIKRKSSIFNDTLMGQLLSTILCKTCKHKSHTFEPFYILELPIPTKNKATLKDCFVEFSKEEEVDCNLWICPQCCQPRKAKKSLQIWRLPPVLVICFKRFINNKDEVKRNEALVTVDLVGEDLGHTVAHSKSPIVKMQSKIYQPFAFIVVSYLPSITKARQLAATILAQ